MFSDGTLRIWKRILCILVGWGLLTQLSFTSPARGEESLKTLKTVVSADSTADLLEMERRLRFSPPANILQPYVAAPTQVSASPHPRLAAKIDGILQKVCAILRLTPKNPQPLRIFLLKDGRQVRQRQLAFQSSPEKPSFGLFGYGSLEGFYEAHFQALFLSLANLHEGILAHEMTHYVLCTALPQPPPHEIQEEWARYVETQLNYL